jgi:hypothetical protein
VGHQSPECPGRPPPRSRRPTHLSKSSVSAGVHLLRGRRNTHVSMWRYPARRAASTAFRTSFGLDCQVPKPRPGILAPVLRVKVVLAITRQYLAPVALGDRRCPWGLLGVFEVRHGAVLNSRKDLDRFRVERWCNARERQRRTKRSESPL